MILKQLFVTGMLIASIPAVGMWKRPENNNFAKHRLQIGTVDRKRAQAEYDCRTQDIVQFKAKRFAKPNNAMIRTTKILGHLFMKTTKSLNDLD